jgi:hypothetical protein
MWCFTAHIIPSSVFPGGVARHPQSAIVKIVLLIRSVARMSTHHVHG